MPEVSVDCAGRSDEDVLHELVSALYDIEEDDRNLRSCESAEMAKCFDSLRKGYRIRREFRFTTVTATSASPALLSQVEALGFCVTT